MLRYKTETRPGLVALYDIRPGNGAGQFLTTPEPAWGTFSLKALVRLLILRHSRHLFHTSVPFRKNANVNSFIVP